jgi:hypothetical protein
MCLVFSCKDISKKDKYFYKILIKLFAIMKRVTIFVSQYNGNEFKKLLKIKTMLYLRTPLHGNEFKVCDELTDEVIAIFFNQQDAIEYINWKTNKQTIF